MTTQLAAKKRAPYIALSDDLKWAGLAGIELKNLPETLTVDSHTLLRKTEFHVTLLASKYLAPILDNQNEEHARLLLKDDLLAFAKDRNLTQFTLTGEYYLVKREERMSVIAIVDMPEIKHFFDHLRHKYDVAFPTQPTHITLYTLQPDKGIWLTWPEELQRDGKEVKIKELANLATK